MIRYEKPYLSGGTVLTVLNQFSCRNKIVDGKVVQYSMLQTSLDFIEAITGSKWEGNPRSISTMVSNYRCCKSVSNRFPLCTAGVATYYDQLIHSGTGYKNALSRMTDFIHAHVLLEYKVTLAKALVEIIRDDKTIDPSEHFFLYGDRFPVTKKQLIKQEELDLSSFLVAILHYILMNRRDSNMLGFDTLEAWGNCESSNHRDLNNYPFGASARFPYQVTVPVINEKPPDYMKQQVNESGIPESIMLYLKNKISTTRIVTTAIADSTEADFTDIYITRDFKLRKKGAAPIRNATIFDLMSISNHMEVLGMGGFGKSMLVKAALRELFAHFLEKGLIPILVDLRDYDSPGLSIQDFLFRCIQSYSKNVTSADVDYFLENNKAVLLLDALDEMPRDNVPAFKEQLSLFINQHPDLPILITSRDAGDDYKLTHFTVFDCCRLSLDQAVELISRITYYSKDAQERFIDALKENLYEDHEDFAGVPLLLIIMLTIFDEYGDIPYRRHELFERVIDVMRNAQDLLKTNKRFVRDLYTNIPDRVFIKYFSFFCFILYTNGNKHVFTDKEFYEIMDSILQRHPLPNNPTSKDFLMDAAVSFGFLRLEDHTCYFIHNTFQEFFVAKHYASAISGQYQDVIDEFDSQKPAWNSDETFGMLYDMKREELDENAFFPVLGRMLRISNDTDLDNLSKEDYENSYWHFLRHMYPYFSVRVVRPEIQAQLEPASDTFEALMSSEPNIYPSSYTYYVFANRNGLFYADDLKDMYWPLELVDYFQSVVHLWSFEYEEVYRFDEFTSLDSLRSEDLVVAYEYVIDIQKVDTSENDRLLELADFISSEDFPLRKEFDHLCEWYRVTQKRVREKAKAPFRERKWDMR